MPWKRPRKIAVKEYILPRRGNTTAVDRLAQLLVMQGVEVNRAGAAFSSGGQTVSGGIVRGLARAAGAAHGARSARSAGFHGRRVSERAKSIAASCGCAARSTTSPRGRCRYQFNMEAVASKDASTANFRPVKFGDTPPGKIDGGKATVAYLVPWGTTAAAKMLTASLRANLRVLSADKSFKQNGRAYPGRNAWSSWSRRMAPTCMTRCGSWRKARALRWSRRIQAGWTKAPISAALACRISSVQRFCWRGIGRPMRGSAGQARWVLEREFGYPVTVIRTQQIGRRGSEQVPGDHFA